MSGVGGDFGGQGFVAARVAHGYRLYNQGLEAVEVAVGGGGGARGDSGPSGKGIEVAEKVLDLFSPPAVSALVGWDIEVLLAVEERPYGPEFYDVWHVMCSC